MNDTKKIESEWFATLPDEARWIEHHDWTIDNYWDSMMRVRSSWRKALNKLENSDINRLQNIGNLALAHLIPGHQKEFESTYASENEVNIPIPDVMIALSFIEYFVRNNEGLPNFTWTIEWLDRIAQQDPADYVSNMASVLDNKRYTDEQKVPIVVRALSMPDTKLQNLNKVICEHSSTVTKPLRLAAALQFAQTDSISDKMELHEYMAKDVPFRLKHTAKDYLAVVMPEVLPFWETFVSLDVSFIQAWNQLQNNFEGSLALALPDSDISL